LFWRAFGPKTGSHFSERALVLLSHKVADYGGFALGADLLACRMVSSEASAHGHLDIGE